MDEFSLRFFASKVTVSQSDTGERKIVAYGTYDDKYAGAIGLVSSAEKHELEVELDDDEDFSLTACLVLKPEFLAEVSQNIFATLGQGGALQIEIVGAAKLKKDFTFDEDDDTVDFAKPGSFALSGFCIDYLLGQADAD
ncbi:hypothetical protein ACFSM5_12580 [Lacibacterium aquatile]|uniref:Uncharacterized protein n=1 Tax=Lacibacterium aquatile TaxID=1168082 RepID=A0ABW5DRE4_9PROT